MDGLFCYQYSRPCGVCVLWEELYGTENIKQVYGLITDWLSSLTDDSRKKLKYSLYDDMCHLSRFARVTQQHHCSSS